MGTETQRGEIHNYRNDYKFNYEIKQKANGEWQIGSIKIRSDNEEGLSDLLVKITQDLTELMESKGFKMVKKVGAD
jgi:hypothetical protein